MGRRASWSLRRRLSASLIGLTATLFAAGAVQNYVAHREANRQLFENSLLESAGLLLQLAHHEIAEHGKILGIELLKAEARPGPYGFQFQIWTSDMQAGYRSAALPTTPLLPFDARGFGWATVNGERWRALSVWDMDHELQIQIAQPQREQRALDRAALLRAAVSALLLLGVAIVLIGYILRRSIEPMTRIASSVGERGAHDLRDVDGSGAPAEVQPLIQALNHLLGRIREALQRERRFTADAAHELRTPLAAIRANAQVLASARSEAERSSSARDLIGSVDRSTRLVEQLLALARADAVLQEDSLVVLDLSVIGRGLVDGLGAAAQSGGHHLVPDLTPACVRGNPALLEVLLRNLLDNALRYSPEGTSVELRTGIEDGNVFVDVADNGPGIDASDRERIFERFYRAQGLSASGSGLGLSIVKRIAELHGARLAVLAGTGGSGTRFRVLFPPANA